MNFQSLNGKHSSNLMENTLKNARHKSQMDDYKTQDANCYTTVKNLTPFYDKGKRTAARKEKGVGIWDQIQSANLSLHD